MLCVFVCFLFGDSTFRATIFLVAVVLSPSQEPERRCRHGRRRRRGGGRHSGRVRVRVRHGAYTVRLGLVSSLLLIANRRPRYSTSYVPQQDSRVGVSAVDLCVR